MFGIFLLEGALPLPLWDFKRIDHFPNCEIKIVLPPAYNCDKNFPFVFFLSKFVACTFCFKNYRGLIFVLQMLSTTQ